MSRVIRLKDDTVERLKELFPDAETPDEAIARLFQTVGRPWSEDQPGLYWVKWTEGQDWDVGGYISGNWYAIGTEERQDKPEIIGRMLEDPI